MVAIYNINSGKIQSLLQCPDSVLDLHYGVGENYIEITSKHDAEGKWVVDGVLVDRPTMTPTVNGLIITDLPIPCSLTTYGETYEIPDGEVTLSYDLAGEYEVKVEAFPYLDWEVTVEQP